MCTFTISSIESIASGKVPLLGVMVRVPVLVKSGWNMVPEHRLS